ncbi:cytochrome P450 [Nocardia bhagyanarayanae]|uniref:Cytochrome P450 n=1 Tax=Nocardia bhagyanarayanae TaxID=1215925 RepID=A0A543FDS6_9NOCA|nr:cytochrome P450 [Nocardia bhagyanarayanae]TQM31912.1 cytochrome P450 [Nocardia bhagyanarayanae]
MTHALDAVRVDLDGIANIAPPAMIQPLRQRSAGGLPQVRLPSGHTAVHVTSYRDVHTVLTDLSFARAETNVEDGPSFLPTIMPTEMLLNLDHPGHGRLKGFVASAYSAATMTRRVPAVHRVLDDALAELRAQRARGSADLVRALLDPVTIGVNVDYLGIPTADIAYFRHLSREMQLAHDTDIDQLLADFWTLFHYIEDLIARRRELRPGLIIDLLEARDSVSPPVSDAEYAAILLGSLVGGDQNILSVITKIAYVALARPELWQYLVHNPDAIPTAVEEFLRLLPLGRISTFPRVTTREVTLSHGVLHPGDIVYADAHAANRDPEVYPDPAVIDPARNGKRHLQFGYGMHHCMGAAMARMEITEVLRRLVTELPTLELAVPEHEIRWETGVLVHRPISLPVTW